MIVHDNHVMRFDVITLFPELIESINQWGIMRKALDAGIYSCTTWNPRNFAHDRHRTVDDRPYGGGPGMLMMYEPLAAAVEAALEASLKSSGKASRVIYMSPQGRSLKQADFCQAATEPGLILVSGRYEGVDERFIEDYVDEEWSVGDYVLSGGEAPAMLVMDAIVRLLPGALGHHESAQQDSFMQGVLDCPHYTRPEKVAGKKVPAVLLGGNHQAIADWRSKLALARTCEKRPDLINLDDYDQVTQKLIKNLLKQN